MIIKRLDLENIRSYRQATVGFPLGKTLFEGDIGSGKSTLLMAIEFAFFGFGTEAGASMLRAGSTEGAVAMVFEADGGEYRVERRLVRKGKHVQQTDCTLKTPEGQLDLSPSELKEKMLEVLQFNEVPDPKAQSWIYRYAVYTPQEEMKAVLGLSPDLRLQVLRRAFRIEDYKIAAENAAELAREVRRKAGEFEGMARGAQELRSSLEESERQGKLETRKAEDVKKKQSQMVAELEKIKMEREQLREQELDLERTDAEIKLHERRAEERGEVAAEETEGTREVATKIESLELSIGRLKKLKPPYRLTASELESRAESLQDKVVKLTALDATLTSKIDDYQSIMKGGKCPVCDRPVDSREYVDREKAKRAEQKHVASELHETRSEEKEMRQLSKRTREYELEIKKLEDLELDLKRHKVELKRRTERAAKAEEEARLAKLKAKEFSAKAVPLARVAQKLTVAERTLEATEKELRELRDVGSRLTEKLEMMKDRQDEMRDEIARKEEAARRRDVLQEHELWLADYFVPTLQLIEMSVMQSLNQEFDSLFQKWFSALVDDPGKEVRVDESFTPIVSQDGYEQDVYFLSGGEKTSVSLAYRLALNTLVQRVSTTMKSNILILDEPTDGFSREQLGSVREVLDEIECAQVIVVSHEKELESFADQVYKVVKENGASRVVQGGA
ncbi:MAG: AAA family ATPase [Nitrososphaerales archaeon]|nr:AAA family ATPase [Nitrososphaerales archaeon]